MTQARIENRIDSVQEKTITVLIGVFACMATLLSLFAAFTIVLVCIAFSVLRISVQFVVQVQEKASQSSRNQEEGESASFVSRLGLHRPFVA